MSEGISKCKMSRSLLHTLAAVNIAVRKRIVLAIFADEIARTNLGQV